MTPTVQIGGTSVGGNARCFIIAEAGVNHDGRPDVALRLIDAAVRVGADAVKFQTFDADRLATADAPKAAYQRRSQGQGESQRDMLKRLELSLNGLRAASAAAREAGLTFLSSPFDEESADVLESLGVPAFKLGSGELTNARLLAHVAAKGRAVLLSTGMSTLGEVDAAVRVLESNGCRDVVLMHCVSAYPAPPSDANLRAIPTLAAVFGKPCGYSDHTPGCETAVVAVALGACVIEKHLTLDRDAPGPDHAASLDPEGFAAFVRAIRIAEESLGDGTKRPRGVEREVADASRRSLVAARMIPAGVVIDDDALVLRRPGTGLSPRYREAIVGRTARVDIPAGTAVALDMLV